MAVQRRFIRSRDEVTVLIHGLWMQGVLMSVMGKVLQSRGFRIKAVSYNFLNGSPPENAQRLYDEIVLLGAKRINLVGHSLGGIVILHLLNEHPDLAIGKVVLIASPVRGSSVAKKVNTVPLLRLLLGRSVEKGLLGGAPSYALDRPLGIITGKGKFGLSALLCPTGGESDGVVLECETLLDNTTDRISLPLSHSALIFSRRCSEYVSNFLTNGQFRV